MNKGLLISIISGLSTLSGLIFTININNKKYIDNIIYISLSIAFIYMILISLFDLIPTGIKNLSNKPFLVVFLYIMIIYTIIHLFFKIMHKNKVEKGNLYFLGILSMITLFIHNVPEGIITYLTTNYNFKLGLKISLSIIMHNIPEGILIAVPIYFSTKLRSRAIGYTFVASLGEILGALFALFFIKNKINSNIIGYILIAISLMMLYIAVEEIFFQIKDKNKKSVVLGLSIGLMIFIINLLIIN